MGMTDRQFDSYTKMQLTVLKKILADIRAKGGDNKDLEDLIKDLESSLQRP